jgi:hypothetical protein
MNYSNNLVTSLSTAHTNFYRQKIFYSLDAADNSQKRHGFPVPHHYK